MKTFAQSLIVAALVFEISGVVCPFQASADPSKVSPAAIGWGNLFVPGLGATLSGEPGRGLGEAAAEIGTYYGGTFGTREGQFSIDGNVEFPTSGGNLYQPLTGQILQEFGLKLHFYDTFYHYQQAVIAQEDSDREKNSPQPIYRGTWTDVLSAPFKWKNVSNKWVFPVIIGSFVFEYLSYKNTTVTPISLRARPTEEALYGTTQIAVIPLGSAFGEEVLFRGFIQREVNIYTDSLPLAILAETSLFALLHPATQKSYALMGGVYYGLLARGSNGDLEPGIASHFWTDVSNGIATYWVFRLAQGKGAPFTPVGINISLPF
jgi:membrane protease YdiL (CAAX protease family)